MAANTLTRGRLRRLADLRPEKGRVLTVFLNLDPAQFATPVARASAVNSITTEAARCVEAEQGLDHEERQALLDDVDRVREVLGRDDVAEGRTRAVAVFACAAEDLLEIVRLPHPVDSRVWVNSRPHLEPLVQVGAPERYCVVLVNRRTARLFVGAGDAVDETDRIEDDVHQQHDQGGWSQARYQRSVEKEKIDHLDHVAEVLFGLFKRTPFDRLVVSAPEELVGQFEDRLHPYVSGRLTARVVLDVENATVEEVRRCASGVVAEAGKRREREALDRLHNGLGQAGTSAVGLSDTLAALGEMRVEILLLADNLSVPGYLDEESGLVSAEPVEGFVQVDDVVEPAIERAIEQSAEVLFVRHFDDLSEHGGIGAVLRF